EKGAALALVDKHLGVVDEDVESAELAQRLVEESGDLGLHADVGGVLETRPSRVANLPRRSGDHVGVPVVDDHPGASPGEAAGDAPADATAGAGDDGDLVAQQHAEALRRGSVVQRATF